MQGKEFTSKLESPTIKLNNGVCIPQLGLGTYNITNDSVAEVVRNAIKIGKYLYIIFCVTSFNTKLGWQRSLGVTNN